MKNLTFNKGCFRLGMVSTTSTKVPNTTNEETAINKSSFSGRKQPNLAAAQPS